jgi:SAM-dependent methyltransferase
VSWFQAEPEISLELIRNATKDTSGRIIDVGGGASRLVDVLLDSGYSKIFVLDVSRTALSIARERLGGRAQIVEWLCGDVRSFTPPHTFDVWHDRAVFHFLRDQADRSGYRGTLGRAVPPGGHAVLATFGPEGPERCSGLPVVRYDAASLSAELGEMWELVETREETHHTPSGVDQQFVYGRFRRIDADR